MAVRGRGAGMSRILVRHRTVVSAPAGGRRPARPRLAAVYGGGGPLGIAYGLGVVDALLAAGVPLRTAPSLGTSAGSWVASCLATGATFEQLRALPALRVPNLTRGLLRGLATEIFGCVTGSTVQAAAVRVPSGGRVLLSGGEHPLADVVAASSAVPWLFAPARIGRQVFVDGGVRSLVHADHAPDADHLLVVAPVAGPMFGPGGRAMDLKLAAELRRWQARTGGQVHVFRPTRQIAALARHPLDLFDKSRAADAYPLAYEQAQQQLLLAPGLAGLGLQPAPRPVA
jgi:predicted acylesterase/phospholipase RssA